METTMLAFLAAPFVASLILTGIHAYLGVHVVERGVIFVDLSLAQIAAFGATIAILMPISGGDPHAPVVYWISLAFTFLGAFVFLVSLPTAALLLVAIFSVHLPYGFSSIKLIAITATGAQFGPPGYECDLLYLACLAALVLGGSGPLAIDGLFRKWKARHP